jgi:hypothetical protein
MTVSPRLTAMMCDGLGWFEDIDFKRMLLVYDRILYLLPSETVPFQDVTGSTVTMVFPGKAKGRREFEAHFFQPDQTERELIEAAAKASVGDGRFAKVAASIPNQDRLYTWRLVNADAGFGSDASRSLCLGQQYLAQALLLIIVLLAADHAGAIPITGKQYVHQLLGAQYRLATSAVQEKAPDALPTGFTSADLRSCAVVQGIVEAFVTDETLKSKTFEEIVYFKDEHRKLFDEFSYTVRGVVEHVHQIPSDAAFARELRNVIATEVWKQKVEIENGLRNAWFESFRSIGKQTARTHVAQSVVRGGLGAMALGVAPALALHSITVGAVLAPVAAAASWLAGEAIDLLGRRSKAKERGLYYLMQFGGA